MHTDILHHIEQLQVELAHVDPRGQTAAVALAVARIAADLRGISVGHGLMAHTDHPTNGRNSPVFMQ